MGAWGHSRITELVLGGPDGVVDATSLDIGCVRMSERCLHSDPPTAAERLASALNELAGETRIEERPARVEAERLRASAAEE